MSTAKNESGESGKWRAWRPAAASGMSALARAKVNLQLSIFPKHIDDIAAGEKKSMLASGLHPLHLLHPMGSVFHSISLADKISLRVADTAAAALEIKISKNSSIPAETANYSLYKDNILVKAHRLLCQELEKRSKLKPAASIKNSRNSSMSLAEKENGRGNRLPALCVEIEKHIPVGAGLGGGSADAACFLQLCNTLFSLNLRTAELDRLALAIGSDVPFFLHGGMALVEGYGEQIKKLPFTLFDPVMLVYKGLFISTKKAFSQHVKLSDSVKKSKFYALKKALLALDGLAKKDSEMVKSAVFAELLIKKLKKFQHNAFREKTFASFAQLAKEASLLNNFFHFVELSGSGSVVFAFLPKEDQSKKKSFKTQHFHSTIVSRKHDSEKQDSKKHGNEKHGSEFSQTYFRKRDYREALFKSQQGSMDKSLVSHGFFENKSIVFL